MSPGGAPGQTPGEGSRLPREPDAGCPHPWAPAGPGKISPTPHPDQDTPAARNLSRAAPGSTLPWKGLLLTLIQSQVLKEA